MRDFIRQGPISKPDWFNASIPNIESSIRLYRSKGIPAPIEAFMVLTPLKHAMRGIYGKDNRGVAWALLKESWGEYVYSRWCNFRYRIGWLSAEMKEVEKYNIDELEEDSE